MFLCWINVTEWYYSQRPPKIQIALAHEKLVEASDVVAKQGLIAHGRGEALIIC